MPRMRSGNVGFGVLPHVHSGGWDDRLYLRYFAGKLAGNISIDEHSLTFFFSLLSKPKEEETAERIAQLLASYGFEHEGSNRALIRNIWASLEEIQSPEVHGSCGKIIGEVLDAPETFPPPVEHEKRLIELFELKEMERRILDFFLVHSIHTDFANYVRNLPWRDQYSFLSLITEYPAREIEEAFRLDAPLMKNGILDLGPRRQNSSVMDMELNGDILSMMSSPDGHFTSLPDSIQREGPIYPLSSFPVEEEVTGLARDLVKEQGPCAILLYGSTGSGKTEFARSLADSAGKHARFFFSEETRSFDAKKFKLRYLNRIMNPREDVLIVDEAEELLRTQRSFFSLLGGGEKTDNKSFINLFMEDFRGVLIFIVNSLQGMDSSLKRRFHLSVHFPENNVWRRLDFWKDGLERRGLNSLFSQQELRGFARDFPLSAGSISSALDTAAARSNIHVCANGEHAEESGAGERSEKLEQFKKALRRLLSAQLELQTGRPVLPRMEEEHEISDEILCTDSPLEDVFRAASRHTPGKPLSMLFSGPPGTGKTTLAGEIAERQGRELRTVRASDILAPFVGQNEQNIRRIFSSTDPKNSVLFIDEADSLFYNRADTRSEWRQSLTNELLSAMESYPGILICATNMLDHLDAALMRRFSFKVRFRPLLPEQRLRAIRLHFPEFENFVPRYHERKRLEALSELTPGDIAAVRRRLRLAEETPSLRRVLDELDVECSYRSGGTASIGFV